MITKLKNSFNPKTKEPLSEGKSMRTLVALKKRSKSKTNKTYWTTRIDGLKSRDAYKKWLALEEKYKPLKTDSRADRIYKAHKKKGWA